MLDEQRFRHLADAAFRTIMNAFDDIDADDADIETAGNTLQITFRGGKRCVLLVHGRGLHSPDQLPVLKEALLGWLAGGRFGRLVLAFCSARPADGGAGALYVLLRRAGR